MYAVIRAGGKQHKVAEGDVIEVERVKGSSDGVEFVPLLVVDDGGRTISGRSELARAVVKASVVGESKGPKVEVFKYRNKTGYRRSAGHRQRYTTIRIESISLPGGPASGGGAKEEGGDGS